MSCTEFGNGGSARTLHEAMICRQCEAVISSALGASLSGIRSASRQKSREAFARAGAIYLACTSFNLPEPTAGRVFGRHRSSIRHACRRMERQRRSEPRLHRALSFIEHALACHTTHRLDDARQAFRAADTASNMQEIVR